MAQLVSCALAVGMCEFVGLWLPVVQLHGQARGIFAPVPRNSELEPRPSLGLESTDQEATMEIKRRVLFRASSTRRYPSPAKSAPWSAFSLSPPSLRSSV